MAQSRPPRRPRGALALLGAVAAGMAIACSSDLTAPGEPDLAISSVSSVTVSPNPVSGMVGQSAQFTATVKNGAGQTVTRAITWSSSDSTIVRVNATGYGTAVGVGSARIIATSGGRSGYASATVTGIPIASVTVTPGSASGAIGDSGQFSAALADASGNPLTGRAITWSSSNTSVATVTATGMAHAVGGGTANIIATSEGKSGQAAVTVTGPAAPTVGAVAVTPGSASGAVGDSGQFSATVTDMSGAPMSGQAVTWSSSDTTVVTVNSNGLARARGAGNASLRASAGGKTGTAAITVTGGTQPPPPPPPPPAQPATPASVSLNPATASLTVGQTQQIGATVRDSAGNTLGASVSWTSSNPAVASVVGGLVTGLLSGNATITATSGAASASASVTVTNPVPPPPPPPPSGGWNNAPASYNLISDQPWNVLNSLGWSDIWDHTGAAIVPDASAPGSPSNVLQVLYPVGWVGGSAPATQAYDFSATKQRMFVGMWWKASSPWQGHPSNVNKIQFLFDTLGRDMYMCMYGPPGGPYELRVSLQLSNIDAWLTPNVNNVPVTVGQWHRLEWLVDQPAGIVQFWMDGTLIGDWRNLTFVAPMTGYKISPTWGGADGIKTQNDYFWYDHVILKGN